MERFFSGRDRGLVRETERGTCVREAFGFDIGAENSLASTQRETYAVIFSLIALFFALAAPAHLGAADIIVTSLADSGPGSLRQAIADAPAGGTIRFTVEGDVVLTSGELLIDKPLRILGGHQQRITVRVASNLSNSRVFRVTGAPVKIGDLTIQDGDNSLFDDEGAGILNEGDLQLLRVTIRDNKSTAGAGIANEFHATLTIINSTISGNLAVDPGICDGGVGGGIANFGGTVNLINATVTDNEGECTGGGIYLTSGTVVMSNTIVGNNHGFVKDCKGLTTGGFISRGFNLDSDATCGLDQPSDLPGVDPLLGPLQDNGGSTDTHLPMAGSPAIDVGDVSTAPGRDQRGVRRPQGPASDIGSVEVEVP